jgi:predicted HTH domain antitoxin
LDAAKKTCRAIIKVPRFMGTIQEGSMEPLDVFTVRDLRSGDLLRDAEEGRLALITKHGGLRLERLLSLGVHRSLALHLFEGQRLTLSQASKVAGVSIEEFVELLAEAGIPAADYPPEELADELKIAL